MSFIHKIQIRYQYSAILLRELVITDFKLRYQNSILGYLWSLLRPLLIFSVLYFVFVRFLRIGSDTPYFAIYLLLGIVLWNFFVELTTGSVSAITAKGDLIRKINFPKYVIILATSVAALINLALNLIIVVIFMLIFGADPSLGALVFMPFLLLELYLLGIALGFLLSALQVKYKDIGYIWELTVQIGFYATPILYPITMLSIAAQKISILNPMAQIIQDARYFLVTPLSATGASIWGSSLWRLVPFAVVLSIFASGSLYFRKKSKYFAEDV